MASECGGCLCRIMCNMCLGSWIFCYFKQKTAYEMRISDWKFRRVLFRSAADSEGSRLRHAAGAAGERLLRDLQPPERRTGRSEERRVGKECVSPSRSRRAPYT